MSSYFFLKNGGINDADAKWAKENFADFPDFGSFVRGWVNEENILSWQHFMPQHYFVCNSDGKIMVDFVGKMENMQKDFSYVAMKLGCEKELKKVNAGKMKNYDSCYDNETREIVRRVYAKDIDLFGYANECPN